MKKKIVSVVKEIVTLDPVNYREEANETQSEPPEPAPKNYWVADLAFAVAFVVGFTLGVYMATP